MSQQIELRGFEFDGHKIETNRDVIKEAVRAWKNKKCKEFLNAYAEYLKDPEDFSNKAWIKAGNIAIANIKQMARYYDSNGPEMKAMREYVKIEQSVKDDIRNKV